MVTQSSYLAAATAWLWRGIFNAAFACTVRRADGLYARTTACGDARVSATCPVAGCSRTISAFAIVNFLAANAS